MPFRGLAWTEEGWRRELGGGAWAAAMAAAMAAAVARGRASRGVWRPFCRRAGSERRGWRCRWRCTKGPGGEQRRSRAWLSSTGHRGVACVGGAERQRRQGAARARRASLPGQGCSEDGRQQWRCSMAALPGRGSVQGCRRACGRGMMACSALLSGSREAEQRREKGGRERERVERERDLTLSFLKKFHMNSKISKNKSCSKFKILQLSFQAQTHLKRS